MLNFPWFSMIFNSNFEEVKIFFCEGAQLDVFFFEIQKFFLWGSQLDRGHKNIEYGNPSIKILTYLIQVNI